MAEFTFDLPGKAAPKGSRVAGVTKSGVRFNRESNPHVPVWMKYAKALLAEQASEQGHQTWPKSVPLELTVSFCIERPKNPKYEYPPQGDTDKFTRALCDALEQAGVLTDDAQIVRIVAEKTYTFAGAARTVGYVKPLPMFSGSTPIEWPVDLAA